MKDWLPWRLVLEMSRYYGTTLIRSPAGENFRVEILLTTPQLRVQSPVFTSLTSLDFFSQLITLYFLVFFYLGDPRWGVGKKREEGKLRKTASLL